MELFGWSPSGGPSSNEIRAELGIYSIMPFVYHLHLVSRVLDRLRLVRTCRRMRQASHDTSANELQEPCPSHAVLENG